MEVRSFDKEKVFFQFHPVSFIDDVVNATNEFCVDVVEELEKHLKDHKAFKSKQRQEQLTKAIEKILNILQAEFYKNLDKFELYLLRNIFIIPFELSSIANNNNNNNTSPASKTKKGSRGNKRKKDESDNKSAEDEYASLQTQEKELDNEIDELTSKILQAQSLNESLRTKHDQTNLEVRSLETVLHKLQVVDKILKQHSIDDLAHSLEKQIEQVKHIQALLKVANQALASVGANENNASFSGPKSRALPVADLSSVKKFAGAL